jgi:ligand-binding SRPBCC domain-containing protein
MSIHRYSSRIVLPVPIEQAWDFFSSPKNLAVITPPELNFQITSPELPERTHAGQIITYSVSPLLGISMPWMTEITHVNEPHFFVDEQRKGPYKLWHHQHHFRAVPDDTEMTDVVHYEVPMGIAGDLINSMIIRKKVQEIFDFRTKKLNALFGK